MAASPRSSSPLHGYDSEGEEPGHGEQEAATPTKKRLRSGRVLHWVYCAELWAKTISSHVSCAMACNAASELRLQK